MSRRVVSLIAALALLVTAVAQTGATEAAPGFPSPACALCV
jgi:hypothetical protein